MGYSTDFTGFFTITPQLKEEDKDFLLKFANTRRMKRNLGPAYGIEGEFYVDGSGPFGQEEDLNVINFNEPPVTQPGLWCQWVPDEEGRHLEWDGGEKFYHYVDWMKYLIVNILAPRGYKVNGVIEWTGEDPGDFGKIIAKDNDLSTAEGYIEYAPEQEILKFKS